ncbi:uncharacterized protein LOC144101863 [Amblyomma americanum]
MYPKHSDAFLGALQANYSLRELSFASSVISDAAPACRQEFTQFLKNNCTLTTLTVYGDTWESELCFILVLDALRYNKTLTSVTLENFTLGQTGADLLPRVVADNNVPRILDLHSVHADRVRYSKEALLHCWAAAFMENKALEELTLPLGIWSPDHWTLFFRLLSAKENVKKVVIALGNCKLPVFSAAYKRLYLSGAVKKVSFTPYRFHSGVGMSDCEVLSQPNLRSEGSIDIVPNIDPVHQLTSFKRVKVLHLDIKPLDLNSSVSTAIGDFIKSTAKLKELRISSVSHGDSRLGNQENWRVVFESLSRNTSIVDLDININYLTKEGAECLADAVKQSNNFRRVAFRLDNATTAFVCRFSHGVQDNYAIIKARLWYRRPQRTVDSDWFHVLDTARRNSGLVTQASQFLSDARCDRRCAAAVEVVSSHSALIAELAAVMSVDEAGAIVMLRDTVRSLQDMHVFMRALGVVRNQVVCHPSKDGRKQLVDLNDDCWRAIRSFLDYKDVRDDPWRPH